MRCTMAERKKSRLLQPRMESRHTRTESRQARLRQDPLPNLSRVRPEFLFEGPEDESMRVPLPFLSESTSASGIVDLPCALANTLLQHGRAPRRADLRDRELVELHHQVRGGEVLREDLAARSVFTPAAPCDCYTLQPVFSRA